MVREQVELLVGLVKFLHGTQGLQGLKSVRDPTHYLVARLVRIVNLQI
jgi:hypothetical protein